MQNGLDRGAISVEASVTAVEIEQHAGWTSTKLRTISQVGTFVPLRHSVQQTWMLRCYFTTSSLATTRGCQLQQLEAKDGKWRQMFGRMISVAPNNSERFICVCRCAMSLDRHHLKTFELLTGHVTIYFKVLHKQEDYWRLMMNGTIVWKKQVSTRCQGNFDIFSS
ncbi:hypothetical protein PHMEG_00037154 [Phytophthora megakarya]|uniref:Uncharacterized protein n=1 Tax=Phytophthora megakarya TaxID=4795 RepID=A0A225UJZ8_9STRA|nr:hypothetical protein PHMEG_00037154 [Phytophthora megakarya]